MSESPEPAVRVTLSDMYQLLQQLDKKMDSVTGENDTGGGNGGSGVVILRYAA